MAAATPVHRFATHPIIDSVSFYLSISCKWLLFLFLFSRDLDGLVDIVLLTWVNEPRTEIV
ncbi:hypothetical protein glysoja_043797 [Glycine soja]|uniref:Uncharacterized protein n=1 Tax=Glycine soja TaxID=3848 RepID=A0A0B2P2N7_GLYSO|nr:hypothetical protein glysoja_043797 [Glycine soja]